jgi:hypothetical protein
LQKALIILFLVISSGCTSRMFISGENRNTENITTEEVISRTIKNNISLESYLIGKGDILIQNGNTTNKFLFTCKFVKPDKFLFSMKSFTGLEGARIFLTKDTILVNDRLNKRVLYGKPEYIERMTGIPYNFINIVFGDLILHDGMSGLNAERINKQIDIKQKSKNVSIRSVVESRIYKASSISLENQVRKEEILLKYSKFSKETSHFPGRIEIQDKSRNLSAKIRVKKIEIPWDGKIEFVPGQGYTKEELK